MSHSQGTVHLEGLLSSARILLSLGTGLLFLVRLQTQIEMNRPDIMDANNRVKDVGLDYMHDCYDFVIIGGGSAGSVLANRLSEDPKWKVLLLEAGKDEHTLSEPPLMMPVLQMSDLDWQYSTEQDYGYCLSMKDGRCNWPRGKALGGSSVINAMLYIRGNKKDYDLWEALGNDGWSYEKILPYFIKSEDMRIPEHKYSKYHGTGGYLTIEEFRYKQPLFKYFLSAAEEIGYDVRDVNGEHQTGFTSSHGTIREGLRCSTAKAFLRSASKRENLHISVESHVEKILIDQNTKKAYGVQFKKHGKTKQVYTHKEVVLSAGSITSPQLLMLSGIGNMNQLKYHDIEPILHLPGVGENLQDHVALGGSPYLYTSNDEELGFNMKSFFDDNSIDQFINEHRGPLYNLPECEVMGFVNTCYANKTEDWPDIQLFLGAFADNTDGGMFGKRDLRLKDDMYAAVYEDIVYKSAYSAVPLLLRPKSRGYIRLKDKNPYSPPLIFPNYYTDPYDMKVMIEGAKIAHALSETQTMKKIGTKMSRLMIPGCEHAGEDMMSDEYLECQARHHTLTIYHPVGTCKMAPKDDPYGVVDPRLKVYGVDGLRVVDASVMPLIISGNTNAPTIMIAEKASDMIKEDWSVGVWFPASEKYDYVENNDVKREVRDQMNDPNDQQPLKARSSLEEYIKIKHEYIKHELEEMVDDFKKKIYKKDEEYIPSYEEYEAPQYTMQHHKPSLLDYSLSEYLHNLHHKKIDLDHLIKEYNEKYTLNEGKYGAGTNKKYNEILENYEFPDDKHYYPHKEINKKEKYAPTFSPLLEIKNILPLYNDKVVPLYKPIKYEYTNVAPHKDTKHVVDYNYVDKNNDYHTYGNVPNKYYQEHTTFKPYLNTNIHKPFIDNTNNYDHGHVNSYEAPEIHIEVEDPMKYGHNPDDKVLPANTPIKYEHTSAVPHKDTMHVLDYNYVDKKNDYHTNGNVPNKVYEEHSTFKPFLYTNIHKPFIDNTNNYDHGHVNNYEATKIQVKVEDPIEYGHKPYIEFIKPPQDTWIPKPIVKGLKNEVNIHSNDMSYTNGMKEDLTIYPVNMEHSGNSHHDEPEGYEDHEPILHEKPKILHNPQIPHYAKEFSNQYSVAVHMDNEHKPNVIEIHEIHEQKGHPDFYKPSKGPSISEELSNHGNWINSGEINSPLHYEEGPEMNIHQQNSDSVNRQDNMNKIPHYEHSEDQKYAQNEHKVKLNDGVYNMNTNTPEMHEIQNEDKKTKVIFSISHESEESHEMKPSHDNNMETKIPYTYSHNMENKPSITFSVQQKPEDEHIMDPVHYDKSIHEDKEDKISVDNNNNVEDHSNKEINLENKNIPVNHVPEVNFENTQYETHEIEMNKLEYHENDEPISPNYFVNSENHHSSFGNTVPQEMHDKNDHFSEFYNVPERNLQNQGYTESEHYIVPQKEADNVNDNPNIPDPIEYNTKKIEIDGKVPRYPPHTIVDNKNTPFGYQNHHLREEIDEMHYAEAGNSIPESNYNVEQDYVPANDEGPKDTIRHYTEIECGKTYQTPENKAISSPPSHDNVNILPNGGFNMASYEKMTQLTVPYVHLIHDHMVPFFNFNKRVDIPEHQQQAR